MNTALELDQLIRQLDSEDLPKVQAFIESLLSKEQKVNDRNGHSTVQKEDIAPERLKIAQKFRGKAKFPATPVNKYEVYEQ